MHLSAQKFKKSRDIGNSWRLTYKCITCIRFQDFALTSALLIQLHYFCHILQLFSITGKIDQLCRCSLSYWSRNLGFRPSRGTTWSTSWLNVWVISSQVDVLGDVEHRSFMATGVGSTLVSAPKRSPSSSNNVSKSDVLFFFNPKSELNSSLMPCYRLTWCGGV
jgi:hypothetical protein